MNEGKIFIVSDLHYGYDKFNNHDKFLSFLNKIKPEDLLIINGDFFDLWRCDFDKIYNQYQSLFNLLNTIANNGTNIYYCIGNHDYEIHKILQNYKSVKLIYPTMYFQVNNKFFYLAHGHREYGCIGQDILKAMENNAVKKMFRGVAKNKIMNKLYNKFLEKFSGKKELDYISNKNYLRFLDKNPNYDVYVFGHTHNPEISIYKGKIFVNTGTWVELMSYIEIYKDEIFLYIYSDKQQEFRPISYAILK